MQAGLEETMVNRGIRQRRVESSVPPLSLRLAPSSDPNLSRIGLVPLDASRLSFGRSSPAVDRGAR